MHVISYPRPGGMFLTMSWHPPSPFLCVCLWRCNLEKKKSSHSLFFISLSLLVLIVVGNHATTFSSSIGWFIATFTLMWFLYSLITTQSIFFFIEYRYCIIRWIIHHLRGSWVISSAGNSPSCADALCHIVISWNSTKHYVQVPDLLWKPIAHSLFLHFVFLHHLPRMTATPKTLTG